MSNLTSKKAFTLVELLIAFTLLGVIAAAALAIDYTVRNALVRGTKRVNVYGKASFAMEHMIRHVRLANDAELKPNKLLITSDYNLGDGSVLGTPSDITDDYEARYEYDRGRSELIYKYKQKQDGTNWNKIPAKDIITDVADCNFTIHSDPPNVEISITVTSGTESVTLHTTVGLWCKGRS